MQIYEGVCVHGPWDGKRLAHDKTRRVLYTQGQRGESAVTIKAGEYQWREDGRVWVWVPV